MSKDSIRRTGRRGQENRIFEDLVENATLRQEVGARIARWIARESEKEAARTFGVSPRTVKSWRAGHLPQMRHLMTMASRWGESFLDDVFAPILARNSGLSERLERLEAEISAIRREVSRATPPLGAASSAASMRAENELEPDLAWEVLSDGETEAGAGLTINGNAPPHPKRWEAYWDESSNRVEVAWFDLDAIDRDAPEMRTFARAMGSVAGGPPSWETVSTNTLALTAVHLVDVTATAPGDYSFRRLGWTGIDMDGVNLVGNIPAEALRVNAQHSYLDVKVFGEPSYSHVTRKLGTGEQLAYTRLIWPALSSHRDQLLWVGIRSEHVL